jgi:hypothetical protein
MRKIILGAAAIVGMLLFNSCNDFLDKIPDNRTDLNSKDKIAELLVNAYPTANYISFCEVMSDNAGDRGPAAFKTSTINTEPFFWKDFSSDDSDTPASYWESCYLAIAHANMALEAIGNMPGKVDLSAEKGEALLCRAYSHFMLVTLFAKTYNPATAASDLGVPYVTEVEKEVRKKYTRENIAKVYENIEKDLAEGLLLIADDAYKAPKWHFTKAAAYAFATRFYLFKKEYKSVAKYADFVLGGDVTLKLRDWNQYKPMSYYELRQTYTQSSERSVLLLHEAVSTWGRYYQSYRYSLSSDKHADFFDSPNVSGGDWLYTVYGSEKSYGIPKFNEYFKKASVDATTGWPFNMIPLFTCEEVLFNKLEAKAMLGDPSDEILADLNKYLRLRVSAYNPTTNALTLEKIASFYKQPTDKENLAACILDLKRVDFLHEGLRWLDIIRLNLEVVHTTYEGQTLKLSPTDPRRVLQIPSKAINDGIPANPR